MAIICECEIISRNASQQRQRDFVYPKNILNYRVTVCLEFKRLLLLGKPFCFVKNCSFKKKTFFLEKKHFQKRKSFLRRKKQIQYLL